MKSLFFFLLAILAPGGSATGAPAEPMGPTVVIPIDGEVSKAQFIFLRRAIKDAERSSAGAIVLNMDTYGGDLHAAVNMVDALGKTRIPTITYVNKNAGSAGALIALGTDRIYMAPVSAIGAAAPVMGGGENLPDAMNDKVISYFSKYFRSAAERKGHNPEIAEAFINKQKEVKFGKKIISEKDSLLTLSPQEAVELYKGKPILAAGIADSLEEVLEQAKVSTEKITIDPAGFEKMALLITTFASLFLIAGVAGVYIEFKTPGFGFPGILGGICLLIYFLGHNLAGLAGMEVMAVFALGMLLILIEVLFFPGIVVLALTGTLLALGALFWAMVDRYPTDPVLPSVEMLATPMINMAIAIAGALVAIGSIAQFLPKTPFYKRMVLAGAVPSGDNIFESKTGKAETTRLQVGEEGITTTRLSPGGKARFAGSLTDVTSEVSYVESNRPVRISSVVGQHVVVEEID